MYNPIPSAQFYEFTKDIYLSNYVSHLQRSGRAEVTVRAYISRIKLFQNYCRTWQKDNKSQPLDSIVQNFASYLVEVLNYRPTSLRVSISAVREFLSFSGFGTVCSTVPAGKSETSVLKKNEQEALVAAIHKNRSAKFRALAMLFLTTGTRVDELRSLRVSSLEFGAEGASVLINGKYGKRVLALDADTTLLLLEWLACGDLNSTDSDDPLLFPNHTGGKMSYTAINAIIKNVSRHISLDLSPRILRNTFVKNVLESETDMRKVAYLTGYNCYDSLDKFMPLVRR